MDGVNSSTTTTDDVISNESLCPPNYTDDEMKVIHIFTFYIEGVVLCVLGTVGLVGNAVSAYILRK